MFSLGFFFPSWHRHLDSVDARRKKPEVVNRINMLLLQLLNYTLNFQSSEISLGMDKMIQTFLPLKEIKLSQRKL